MAWELVGAIALELRDSKADYLAEHERASANFEQCMKDFVRA